MSVILHSFGFKHGAAPQADRLFDARQLPNPYHDHALRFFSGQDAPVKAFFERHPEVGLLADSIADLASHWRHSAEPEARLRIAMGCVGGQHRSVYLAEAVAERLNERGVKTEVIHRENSRWPDPTRSPEREASKPSL